MLLVSSSCKKKSSETTYDGNNIVFSSAFDTHADLVIWSQSSGGQAVIDQNTAKLTATDGCFQFETIDLIPVETGKTYTLKFKGKVIASQAGDPVFCAGDFLIYIMQGSTVLLSQSFGNYPDWVQKSFSFQATKPVPISIKFLIGTKRGVWIDDLSLTEQ